MPEVIIHTPRLTVRDGWPTITANVAVQGRGLDVYIRASRAPLSPNADPFLAAALVPAMRLNAPVVVHGSVSAGLIEHTTRIQDVFLSWYPEDMHRVAIHADSIDGRDGQPQRRTGSFFSGGIDSFYNALKHAGEIDDLIFIHGFDMPLHDTHLRQMVSGRLHEAARELRHDLIEVETNVRDLLTPYTDWLLHSHGAALAAAALSVAPQFRQIFVAASHSYLTNRPHGSHPLLDPLWGHQSLALVHDGCEHSRWPKAEQIIANETVQRHLRVCWQHPRREYNCGRCYSCVMVMIFARVMGLAERCQSFPPLDLAQVTSATIETTAQRGYYQRLLTFAEKRSNAGLMQDDELLDVLRARVQRATDEGMPDITVTPEIRNLQARLAGCQVDNRRLQKRLQAMESSISWRLTAPLRASAHLARRVAHGLRS